MPTHCQVVGISPFMRSLITEALDLPLEYERGSRAAAIMRLIQREMPQLPARRFVERPSIHEAINDWSTELGMSRRAFTRLFRRGTGLSFQAWRQQARLLCAMPRLAAGEAVTTVAIDLGYENPTAFTLMF